MLEKQQPNGDMEKKRKRKMKDSFIEESIILIPEVVYEALQPLKWQRKLDYSHLHIIFPFFHIVKENKHTPFEVFM